MVEHLAGDQPVARPDDGVSDPAVKDAEVAVGHGGGLLHVAEGLDEVGFPESPSRRGSLCVPPRGATGMRPRLAWLRRPHLRGRFIRRSAPARSPALDTLANAVAPNHVPWRGARSDSEANGERRPTVGSSYDDDMSTSGLPPSGRRPFGARAWSHMASMPAPASERRVDGGGDGLKPEGLRAAGTLRATRIISRLHLLTLKGRNT